MKEAVELIYVILILLISMGSIFLNVWLANACRFYKSSMKSEEYQTRFWKETALLYQQQMHEAVGRYWKDPS